MGFIVLACVDESNRAVKTSDIRMIADDAPNEDGAVRVATVTLCDGTWFAVKGNVSTILNQIEELESH